MADDFWRGDPAVPLCSTVLSAQLLNRAIADARQQGGKGLVLTCKDKLVHYYAKFGFVNEGVSQSTHGNNGVEPDAADILTGI